MSAAYEAFTAKQDGIYGNFAAGQEAISQNGLQVDEGGTQVQSGYLVAWRLPEGHASDMAGFSGALNEVVPSVVYGRDHKTGLDNAHVTLSDLDVVKGRTLNPDDEGIFQTLNNITYAVQQGIDAAGGLHLPDNALRFEEGVLHNGRVAIMPGQGSAELFAVRESVVAAAGALGVGLKGAWGSHSTTSRVLEARGPEDSGIPQILSLLDGAPVFGNVRPTSLDVGYFNTTPDQGFDYRPVVRFEVTSGPSF
jgi:hypothetical protein